MDVGKREEAAWWAGFMYGYMVDSGETIYWDQEHRKRSRYGVLKEGEDECSVGCVWGVHRTSKWGCLVSRMSLYGKEEPRSTDLEVLEHRQ